MILCVSLQMPCFLEVILRVLELEVSKHFVMDAIDSFLLQVMFAVLNVMLSNKKSANMSYMKINKYIFKIIMSYLYTLYTLRLCSII